MKFWQVLAMTDMDQIPTLALKAEELGFEGVTLGDHLITFQEQYESYPESDDAIIRWYPDTHWPDPWVQFAALAQITKRIKFLTTIFVLPMRDPFSIAKSVSTAALISNDRIVLGTGIGWQESEFNLVEREFRARGARCDEMLDVIRLLMSGEVVEYHGKYFDFPKLQMSPGTGNTVPFWVGGHSDAALRRAARYEGWVGAMHDLDDTRRIMGILRREREAIGRTMDDFNAIFSAGYESDDAGFFRAIEDLGVNHISLPSWLDEKGRASVLTLDQKIAAMEKFAEQFMH